MSKSKLGKGVDVLFQVQKDDLEAQIAENDENLRITNLDPHCLKANPNQPRHHFDQQALEELAASIKEYGIIQPIIAEKNDNGDYIIVAGERRTRAACIAELSEVPVIVMSAEVKERAELALIENIQREDLNPIEEAKAFRAIMDIREYNQDDLAQRIGKSRSAVANALRLLKLPEYAQEGVISGEISAGHARTILSVITPSNQATLFQRIREEKLSVREAEVLATALNGGSAKSTSQKKAGKTQSGNIASPELAELKHIEQQFIDALGTKVQIKGSFEKGTIEIAYFSQDNLNDIFTRLCPDDAQ